MLGLDLGQGIPDRLLLRLGGRDMVPGPGVEVTDLGLVGQLAPDGLVPLPRQLVPVDPLVILAKAGPEIGLVGDEQHLACVGLAAVLGLPLTRKLCGLLCDLLRACGVGIQHTLGDAVDLIPTPIRTRGPAHTELTRQRATHTRLDNARHRTQLRTQSHCVQSPPLAIRHGLRRACDDVVRMVMRFAVPVGPLQPGGHHDPCTLPPGGLDVADLAAGPGVRPDEPGPLLHVDQGRVVGLLEDLLDPGLPCPPELLRLVVTGQHRPPGVLPERSMEYGDALVVAHRGVRVDR